MQFLLRCPAAKEARCKLEILAVARCYNEVMVSDVGSDEPSFHKADSDGPISVEPIVTSLDTSDRRRTQKYNQKHHLMIVVIQVVAMVLLLGAIIATMKYMQVHEERMGLKEKQIRKLTEKCGFGPDPTKADTFRVKTCQEYIRTNFPRAEESENMVFDFFQFSRGEKSISTFMASMPWNHGVGAFVQHMTSVEEYGNWTKFVQFSNIHRQNEDYESMSCAAASNFRAALPTTYGNMLPGKKGPSLDNYFIEVKQIECPKSFGLKICVHDGGTFTSDYYLVMTRSKAGKLRLMILQVAENLKKDNQLATCPTSFINLVISIASNTILALLNDHGTKVANVLDLVKDCRTVEEALACERTYQEQSKSPDQPVTVERETPKTNVVEKFTDQLVAKIKAARKRKGLKRMGMTENEADGESDMSEGAIAARLRVSIIKSKYAHQAFYKSLKESETANQFTDEEWRGLVAR